MRFLVYVLYHDEMSREYVLKNYPFSWVKPVFIPTTNYFESIFLVEMLQELYEDWKDLDYVGLMTWKANKKVSVNEQNMLLRMIQGADMIPLSFYRNGDSSKVITYAQKCHPKFKSLWSKMTKYLGYNETDAMSDDIPAFYYNYWLARPEWMLGYIEHIKKAHRYLEEEPSIQAELNSDSTYALDKPRPGMPYITYHCFLLERLPCLYFWSKGAKILPTM
jgi:hypothetical protein